MILSEQDARTKWCPFARVMYGNNNAGNRFPVAPKDGGGTNCIASDCMAWRRAQAARAPEYETTTTEGGVPADGETWEHVGNNGKAGDDMRLHFRRVITPAVPAAGFCGLAHADGIDFFPV